MNRLVAALVASIVLAAGAPASAITIGGVDFGPLGDTMHLETTTLAETFINGAGQQLMGYGAVTTVNGNANYGGTLYYFFHDYTVTAFTPGSPDKVTFTGGVVDLYFTAAPPVNLLGQNSPANVAFITGLTPWVELTGHTFRDPGSGTVQTLFGTGLFTGATLSANGEGLLDANPGAFGLAEVQAYFHSQNIDDFLGGFADIALTSSSNNFVLNPHDVSDGFANGCQDGTAAPGAWCMQGTLNTRGTHAVAEPATLVLVGIGLGALGFVGRRKQS